jgi:putative glutamine amidotransferase
MKRIAITQRVHVDGAHGERRDALDQRWVALLEAAGLVAVPVPNTLEDPVGWLAALAIDGILLSGGNDLEAYGGDAPERDRLETALVDWAIAGERPLLGVCRGMQVIQHRFGVPLRPVAGHVTPRQTISLEGRPVTVNSYHAFGASDTVPDLRVTGRSEDGVVKALQHRSHRLRGIMWHPERIAPFRADDLALLRNWFGGEA